MGNQLPDNLLYRASGLNCTNNQQDAPGSIFKHQYMIGRLIWILTNVQTMFEVTGSVCLIPVVLLVIVFLNIKTVFPINLVGSFPPSLSLCLGFTEGGKHLSGDFFLI